MLLHHPSFFQPHPPFQPADDAPDRPRIFNHLLHKPPPSPPPYPYSPASASGSPSGSSTSHTNYEYNVSDPMYDHEGYYHDSAASASPGSPAHPAHHPQYASPSPVASASPPLEHPYSAPANQPAFPNERFLANPAAASSSRYAAIPRSQPTYSDSPLSMLDARRMSEPTVSPYTLPAPSYNARYPDSQSQYDSPPSRYALSRQSSGSVHDFSSLHLPQPQHSYPSGQQQQQWSQPSSDGKYDEAQSATDESGFQIPAVPAGYGHEEPLSPLQSTFSGSSTTSGGGGPSPNMPFTEPLSNPNRSPATSTASRRSPVSPSTGTGAQGASGGSGGSNKKTYSFIPLPGQVRKRPRRRYDEIERNYLCSWPGCSKAYGTLNHLNAHVVMQGHGQRRTPAEFKELRKQWRKQKKEEQAVAVASSSLSRYPQPSLHPQHQHPTHSHSQHLSPTSAHPTSSPFSLPRHRMSLPSMHQEYEPVSSHAHHGGFRAPGSSSYAHPQAHAMMYGSAPSYLGDELRYPPLAMPEDLTGPAMRPLHVPQGSSYSVPAPARYGAGAAGGFAGMGGGRLPADSTLLTPLPGYEPPKEEEEDGYRR